jgi:diguanylate cyclase (GGDEF)-like protein
MATAAPLPSPHGVALEVMRLTQREDVSLVQISNVLRADPAMSGRLIKAANVAAQSGRRPVSSVGDAVTALGMTVVRSLALGFSLISDYGRGNCVSFDYQAFWSRSLLVALSAQGIARHVRAAAPDELFACGLLAKVGKLAFATLYPVAYSELLAKASAHSDADLRSLEQERFGIDNAEMSAMMIRDWGIPEIFASAAEALAGGRHAAAVTDQRSRDVLQALRIAVELADLCFADAPRRRQLLPELLAGAARIGIGADALSALSVEILKQWDEWGLLLRVSTGGAGELAAELREGGAPPPMQRPEEREGAEFPLRVLIAEHDQTARKMLATAIEVGGHHVRPAACTADALGEAVNFRPQVLIAEVGPGGVDGNALCRALRETAIGKNLYVMMLIPYEDETLIEGAFAAGADDYVVRPVSSRLLIARLRSARRLLEQQEQMASDIQTIRTLATELATNNRRLEQAAATDPLTTLPNRRYMMERLVQAWAASQRRAAPLSCIAIDIDHFKRINDTLGHAAGDAALRHVAGLLRSNARLQDLVCRTGGEEFLVICPDISRDEARQCAERLRVAVAAAPFDHGAGAEPITISAGVACAGKHTEAVEVLLQDADRALYHAKAAGRDRVSVA